METQVNQRVVLVPFPFQGHMTPMFQLGTVLQSKGLSVTIVHTCYNAPDPSHHPHFDFHAISDNLTSNDTPTTKGIFAFIDKINVNFELPLQEFLVQKIEQETEESGHVVGIIYDALMYCAEAVADNLKIPSMVIRTSFASYVPATLAMPRLYAEGYFPRRPSVVLVPFPFQGHLTPMLQLGTALHSKGISIIIAHTIYNSPNPSSHPDFIFLPIVDNLPDHPDTSTGNCLALVKTINTNCEEPLRDSLAQIMKQRDAEDQVVCIIYDTIMYCSEAVADHLKLHCLNFRTIAASAALVTDSLPALAAAGHIPRPSMSSNFHLSITDSMWEDMVPGFPDLRFKDISTSDLGSFKDVVEDRIFTNISSKYSANIWNTFDHLEQTALAQFQHKYPVPTFSVGPLHMIAPCSSSSQREADTNCIAWLNKQAPRTVIYVSIGSLVVMEKKVIHEMAWGLASSKQPFLWVIRTDSASESEWKLLPREFSQTIGDRGCIVKWAPQSEVLAHNAVGGFWSHCGWNSTLESISQGVPMICQPFNGDQHINARYLSHVWKLGLQFENALEKEKIKQAIIKLMVDEEGKEIRQNAINMKEKIRLSVSKGGSSYNSMNNLAELISSFQMTK